MFGINWKQGMNPEEKAIELISDYSEMQPTSANFSVEYKFAKLNALYAANTAKWSHETESKEWIYWEQVKQEIKKL